MQLKTYCNQRNIIIIAKQLAQTTFQILKEKSKRLLNFEELFHINMRLWLLLY